MEQMTTSKRTTGYVGLLVAMLVLVLALLCGCAASEPESLGKAGYSFGVGSVDIDGATLTVDLYSHHGDGHDWTVAMEGTGLNEDGVEHQIQQEGVEYDEFTFTGDAEGTQTIVFTCATVDDPDGGDATVTVEVTTNKSGQITSANTTASDGTSGKAEVS